MRKDTLKFAKEKYFNGHSDTRSVQENFNLIASFIEISAEKHIPSKTSRSVSSVPWITPEIRRKIRKKNETHAKAKRTDSAKIRSKFETLRREIKADIRKQHDLYVNNLVGDVKANPRNFYRYINSQGKIYDYLQCKIYTKFDHFYVKTRMSSVMEYDISSSSGMFMSFG